ncbi:type I-PGING CRISPR-associated protein Cas5p [Marinilongibacter aquaticus]|uniref:type I-PGING CRISPR-associated protein Cas5p n=1 Tax=Marinilongibacter aquaticus TaxID=2975157 RepID=UPI0021BDAEAB|nr:type I-PGING CRISPR-associated protein Cas5p [Marinilongibacter aquaticus]UBM57207.1 type I-PGING CRISPR-associated protein Cas5p [Marinilongibacter aquaticus]
MKPDLSMLFRKPKKNKQVILTIEPLAPLSIVSTLPGSYYKSLDKPTKANLCGMFENVLGWHIGPKDRSKILKEMKRVYKKSFKLTDFEVVSSAVGYTSLLGHLFDTELPLVPSIIARYDDLWTQQLKHDDARHIKGTANLSYHLIKEKLKLPTDDKGKVSDKDYGDFLKGNYSKFPMYYTSPTPREFIVFDGNYQIKLSISSHLLEGLEQSLQENNLAYLGTNEGWVDLSFKEI